MSEPVKIVLKRGNNTYVAFANKIELDNWKPGQDVPVDGRPGKRVVQFTQYVMSVVNTHIPRTDSRSW